MTTHPLANDPSVPANIRAAFARVTCQIVRTLDDGTEAIRNFISRDQAERELSELSARAGLPTRDGRVVVAVEIRDL